MKSKYLKPSNQILKKNQNVFQTFTTRLFIIKPNTYRLVIVISSHHLFGSLVGSSCHKKRDAHHENLDTANNAYVYCIILKTEREREKKNQRNRGTNIPYHCLVLSISNSIVCLREE